MNPADYEAWYHTARGKWIGDTEYHLLIKMFKPVPGSSLLDVGCGTGYFSRRFADAGLKVYGMDPDNAMLAYAHSINSLSYLRGDAVSIPLADNSVDYCTAITSLCFVVNPRQAIHEMLRVSRRGTIIGLLNRESRLYKQKYELGAYRGARWDTAHDVQNWLAGTRININLQYGSAVFFPDGNFSARIVERILPSRLRWGSFLAVALHHNI